MALEPRNKHACSLTTLEGNRAKRSSQLYAEFRIHPQWQIEAGRHLKKVSAINYTLKIRERAKRILKASDHWHLVYTELDLFHKIKMRQGILKDRTCGYIPTTGHKGSGELEFEIPWLWQFHYPVNIAYSGLYETYSGQTVRFHITSENKSAPKAPHHSCRTTLCLT